MKTERKKERKKKKEKGEILNILSDKRGESPISVFLASRVERSRFTVIQRQKKIFFTEECGITITQIELL